MKYCPYCGGDISAHLAVEQKSSAPKAKSEKRSYKPLPLWKKLVGLGNERLAAPPSTATLVNEALESLPDIPGPPYPVVSTMIHLVFDREIVPRGGILHKAALLEGRTKVDIEQLHALGYATLNGQVVLANETPVGPAWCALEYWGGEAQYRRWHLAEPITVCPSRNGDPFFMDEAMICFGARWVNVENMSPALLELLELFITGLPDEDPIARPLVLYIHTQ